MREIMQIITPPEVDRHSSREDAKKYTNLTQTQKKLKEA
jgi:hypothetical protein